LRWLRVSFFEENAMETRFAGIIPPMVTPLTPDERIDGPAVERLVNFLIGHGVHGLFILGSIGEGAFLRPAEKRALAEATVAAARGRVPVIAGVLEPGTAQVIEGMRLLALPGIAAYVVTTPYYYGGFPSANLREHFHRVADAADRPILAYNIPQNTHVAMKADLMAELADVPNIAGVKDSAGDWFEDQVLLLRPRRTGFAIFQGNQVYAGVSLLAGADGLVPGHANIWPDLLVGMYNAACRKEMGPVWQAQTRLNDLMALRARAPIYTFKAVAQALGLMGDTVAAPLPRLSPEEARQCVAAHAALGLPLD
jgi:4-hydroxy-tetrahydrodipicolinate synthase